MTESSAPWDGTSTGDATLAAYDAPTEWAAYWRSVAGAGAIATNLGGVFRGELNQLHVTAAGAVSPASVNTGRALAYGTWYQADAAVSVAIPTPAVSTRIDRIVLRKSWAAQTVRVTRIAGVEGGGAPSLVQVAGTTWDTPLAQVSITTGAVVTVTDEREFLGRQPSPLVKPDDESVNNSAALQNDDDFVFPVLPGDIWLVKQRLRVSGVDTGSGIKMAWSLPAGATYRITAVSMLGGSSPSIVTGTTTINAGPGGIAYTWMDVETVIRIGDTGGTAQFQWAQVAAAVGDTTIAADSELVALGVDA